MRASPVDLIGGYYKSDSLPWACQDTVNWLPVMAEVEGTRSLKMLETPPGLKPYQQIGTGPIRGMHDCEGLRLVVSGRYLYRITNAGVGVPIGVIPGVGRVSMTHNQFETGYQVLVENGQPGGGYVYNTVDQSFARITDEGYPGSISSDYLDSYLLGVEPFGRFWFHSDLASATSYNTLDRYEAEASPDKIVGLAVSGQEVVVFGQRTTEFFMNVGAATGTFQNRNTGFDRGCASRDTIAKLDNSIFWLGDDGIVYRLNGYAAQPVSTRALDQQLSRYNLAQAFAFVWEDRGHKVYYLTFPDGQTFGYDVVTGLWHRRESFGLDRWRLTHVVEWSGKKYGGDFQTGRIFLIDWDYHLEGSQEIISERVSPGLSDNQSALGIPSAELRFDTGQGPGTVPPPLYIVGDQTDGVLGDDGGLVPYTALGGVYPFKFSITAGSLPAGRTLNPVTGEMTGTFTAAGSYTWTVSVTDFEGRTATLTDTAMVVSGNVALTFLMDLPPAGPVGTIAWSPEDRYLAISSSQNPYLWVYRRDGDALTLLSLPATGMTSRAQGLTWSPDGSTLAVAPESAVTPFLLRRSGDVFTKQALGDLAPLEQERGLNYSANGDELKITYSGSIRGWSIAAGMYTSAGLLATLPANSAFTRSGSDYSRDSTLFATGLDISPWLALFSANNGALTPVTLPVGLSSAAKQTRFSVDSRYLGWATTVTPFVKLYRRSGNSSTFSEITGIPASDASAASFAWSQTSANFAVGGTQLRIYKRAVSTLTIVATWPITGVTGIAWSPSGKYIACLRTGGTTILKASIS